MKITLDVKAASDSLRELGKVLNNPDYVLLIAGKAGISAFGTNGGRTMRVTLSGTVQAKGKVGIALPVLMGVLKNRQSIELEFNEKEAKLKYKQGRYNGDIIVTPVDDIELSKADGHQIKFTPDILALFGQLLTKTAISSIYIAEDIPTHVALGKVLEVCSYDNYHIAYVKTRHAFKGEHSMSLPANTFSTINQTAKGKGYSLTLAEATIYASTSDFDLVMPIQQTDSGQGIPQIQNYITETKKAKELMRVTMSPSTLVKVLENAKGIHESGAGVELTASDKGLKIGLSSSYGSMNDSVKAAAAVSNKKPVRCDPLTLLDLLDKISAKEIDLVATDRCLFIEIKSKEMYQFYACGLI